MSPLEQTLSRLQELCLAFRPVYVAYALLCWILWRVLYQLILWPRFLSPLRALPGPPLGSVLAGQFPVIMKGEQGIPQREWTKQYGPVVRVVGPIGIERLIITRFETLQKVLVSDWVEYPRPSFMKEILGFVAGYGLLTVTGDEHKKMRKAMNPAFSLSNLMAQTQMCYDPIYALISVLEGRLGSQSDASKEMVMSEYVTKVALDIICKTAFGYNCDSLRNPHNELAEAYEEVMGLQEPSCIARIMGFASMPGFKRFLNSEWAYRHRHWFSKLAFFSPLYVAIDSMHRIKQISAHMLQEKLQESAVTPDASAKRDIMSLLVRARKADMEQEKAVYTLTNQQMMDQVLTFLTAGHETVASGLSWTLWLLANDKHSQNELRKEVKPIFDNNPRPDYRELKDLPWLDGVIMESLRVLPPVPMSWRQAAKTDYIEGVLVPKGTLFYIPIRVVNTSKEIWGENAEEFYPPRWRDPPKNHATSLSLLSFFGGPHACIGKTMAIMEMKVVIAALITRFEFEPIHDDELSQPVDTITMKGKTTPIRVKRVI
ncbi:hypothetical protein HGRIS_005806 [Hohenbuehelia grisea]|uniref:Cytochrome P450 n=1 Tax=Hohenbuehelia grisea TaxID=104357 RepID=A0ABR3JXX4_9AGAR